jgi:hypothetical protein
MGKRAATSGDNVVGLILLGIGAALYFAFPIIAAAGVYGTFTGIVVGLFVSECRARPRPAITNEKQLEKLDQISDEENSAIQSLEEQQEELFQRKAEIYRQGDQSGLVRRQSDGRFDARKGGRSLNAQLAKLDARFEEIEDEIMSMRLESAHDRQQRANEFTEWRSKYALVIAFRAALGGYIICAAGLTLYNPQLLREGSQFIALRIWPHLPWLATLYGPLVVASVFAIAVVLFLKNREEEMTVEYTTDWLGEERDENINKFITAEDEQDVSEEGGLWEDSQADEDEEQQQSPYEILGVPTSATREQIIIAYRELIKQYHPDFQHDRGQKLRELAEHESQLLNWAKEEALKRC